MLYTRKGDNGTTKLFDSPQGERVSKNDIIFDALGTVDELNSSIGYTKALVGTESLPYALTINEKSFLLKDILENLQNHLFSIQAELAGSKNMISQSHIEYEEAVVAGAEKVLPEIKTFLITGGDVVSAYLDVCRTIARRTERILVTVSLQYPDRVSKDVLQYTNRLSSVLYALARFVNHTQNMQEKPPTYR